MCREEDSGSAIDQSLRDTQGDCKTVTAAGASPKLVNYGQTVLVDIPKPCLSNIVWVTGIIGHT